MKYHQMPNEDVSLAAAKVCWRVQAGPSNSLTSAQVVESLTGLGLRQRRVRCGKGGKE